MNWKEHPHLFANGKFYCAENGLTITGITKFNNRNKFWFENDRFWWADECQLITRPIEDMTDEEWENNYFDNISEYKRYKHKHLDSIPFEAVIDFLSIGCYPFSDTEDVIFKN